MEISKASRLCLPGFRQPFPAQRSQQSLKKGTFHCVIDTTNGSKATGSSAAFPKGASPAAIKQTGREAFGSLPVSVRRSLLPSVGDHGETDSNYVFTSK